MSEAFYFGFDLFNFAASILEKARTWTATNHDRVEWPRMPWQPVATGSARHPAL